MLNIRLSVVGAGVKHVLTLLTGMTLGRLVGAAFYM